MKKNKLIYIFIFLLSYSSIAQIGALTCASLESDYSNSQICATSISFENQISNDNANILPTCFQEPIKAASWFFMKVSKPGNIQIKISQSNTITEIDVDFALWGPFNSMTNVCSKILPINQVDCSWSVDSVEIANITNANKDDIYILMVDNYDKIKGQIKIQQESGTGTLDCSFLSDISIKNLQNTEIVDVNKCKGENTDLKAIIDITNFNGNKNNLKYNFEWSKDGVVFKNVISSSNNFDIVNVSQTGAYTVKGVAFDSTDSSINPNALAFPDIQTDNIDLLFISPPVLAITELSECDFGIPYKGFSKFNLLNNKSLITNNDNNISLKFFKDINLTQEIIDPSLFINSIPFQQNIYVIGTFNQVINCFSQPVTMTLKVSQATEINYPDPEILCIGNQDTFGKIDFEKHKDLIKNTFYQNQNVSILFYLSENDLFTNQNQVTNTTQLSVGTTKIFVKVLLGNNCYGGGFFNVKIKNNFTIQTIKSIEICENESYILAQKDSEILSNLPLNSKVSYFSTSQDAVLNQNELNKYNPTQLPEIVYVRIYDADLICFITNQFNVIKYLNPKTITLSNSTILNFNDENKVSVFVEPVASYYKYKLNDGFWQNSNQFLNLPLGLSTIYVTNPLSCKIIEARVFVADYLKFFTPNNDSYNDFWKLELGNCKCQYIIYIFDRYGKLVKTISKFDDKWDGTFNGTLLSADDYWFRLVYTKEDNNFEFNSHFTLKR